jgi:hypothetical protein
MGISVLASTAPVHSKRADPCGSARFALFGMISASAGALAAQSLVGCLALFAALIETLLEFLLGLTKIACELRDLRTTEEHQDDNENDDDLWSVKKSCKHVSYGTTATIR